MSTDLEAIGAAALDYVVKRVGARELKTQRNGVVCDHQEIETIEPPDGIGAGVETVTGFPCWQMTEMRGGSVYEPPEPYPIDPADYCPACKHRQALHEQYHRAAQQRAGAYRKLERLVKKLKSSSVVGVDLAAPGTKDFSAKQKLERAEG